VRDNPSVFHVAQDIPRPQVAAEWVWQNWCGGGGLLRARFVAGDNLLTRGVPLRFAARCNGTAAPSTLEALPS
jgi:hypothetical protein